VFRSLCAISEMPYFGPRPTSGLGQMLIADLDMRKTTRYAVASPASYRWVSVEGQPLASRGITRDISSAGAFVFARTHPPLGSRIEVEISLPNLNDTRRGARLFGLGQVVRAERSNENEAGFAVSVLFDSEPCDHEAMPQPQTESC
jgi:hypothetical protein